jgi:hypothetical protein
MKFAFVLSAGALAFRSFVYSAGRWRERHEIRRAGGERDGLRGLEAKRAVGNENAADNQAGQRPVYITISLTKVSIDALIRGNMADVLEDDNGNINRFARHHGDNRKLLSA